MTDDELHHNSTFKVEYIEQARKLTERGFIDAELIDFFGCGRRTFYDWRRRYPEFADALKMGKEVADEKVVDTLLRKATGYSFDSEKIFCQEGQVIRVPTVEHVPPSDTAMIFWLKNRQGWRDKVDVEGNVGVTVTINGADADL